MVPTDAKAAMGFPVRTKRTGNTEHMFSQWGLVGTGNREQGTSQSSEARRPAGPPEAKLAPQKFFLGGGNPLENREQGTGNREHAVFPKCSRNMFRNHSGKTHRCAKVYIYTRSSHTSRAIACCQHRLVGYGIYFLAANLVRFWVITANTSQWHLWSCCSWSNVTFRGNKFWKFDFFKNSQILIFRISKKSM